MKTIEYGKTKVMTTETKNKKGVYHIDVEINDYYDDCVDHPTMETELAKNTSLFLTNMFKNLH